MNCTQTNSYSSLKPPHQLVVSANIFSAVLNWCWNKFVVRHWGSPILMSSCNEPWRNDTLFKERSWWDIACVLKKIYVQGYATLFFHVMWFHDFQKCWWFDFYLLLIFLRIRFNYSCGCQEWPPESIMFEVCYESHLHLVCLKWISLFSISRSFLLYKEIYSERSFPVAGLWEAPLCSYHFSSRARTLDELRNQRGCS